MLTSEHQYEKRPPHKYEVLRQDLDYLGELLQAEELEEDDNFGLSQVAYKKANRIKEKHEDLLEEIGIDVNIPQIHDVENGYIPYPVIDIANNNKFIEFLEKVKNDQKNEAGLDLAETIGLRLPIQITHEYNLEKPDDRLEEIVFKLEKIIELYEELEVLESQKEVPKRDFKYTCDNLDRQLTAVKNYSLKEYVHLRKTLARLFIGYTSLLTGSGEINGLWSSNINSIDKKELENQVPGQATHAETVESQKERLELLLDATKTLAKGENKWAQSFGSHIAKRAKQDIENKIDNFFKGRKETEETQIFLKYLQEYSEKFEEYI